MDCSIPCFLSFTVSWSLLEFMSAELVRLCNHLILCGSLLPLPSIFPSSGSFQVYQLFASGGQSIGASASASVLPMKIQSWFPLKMSVLSSLLSKGLSGVLSNTTVQKHQLYMVDFFKIDTRLQWINKDPSKWIFSHFFLVYRN